MSSALQMTLARDPEARADILDVRLELDPSNELVEMPFAEQHQQN